MMKRIYFFSFLLFTVATVQSQNTWKGKKCAIVLTYDDAINQHLNNALPTLDSLGLRATFYITAYSSSIQTRLNEWKRLPLKGHELGNHTLYHPCNGGVGREWVKPEYDLKTYTVQRIVDESRMTNIFLQALDGKTERTFAFTCADMKVQDSAFIGAMKKDFKAARAVRNEMHKINEIDLYNVDCYLVNGQTGDQLIEWVKKAIETESLLVILFHGVGGGNGLDVTVPAHRALLQYIKKNEKDIWVAPLIDVANYVGDFQKKK